MLHLKIKPYLLHKKNGTQIIMMIKQKKDKKKFSGNSIHFF